MASSDAQIDACFGNFRIGTVKLGTLANKQVIDAVADALEHHRPAFIVLEPHMVATSSFGPDSGTGNYFSRLSRVCAHESANSQGELPTVAQPS
jgi:hypothetical protein